MKLEKRVALITGAAMGIGKAIAMEFMREGANTVVTDINDEMAQKTVHEMNALNGPEAIAIQMDVTDFASIEAAVKHTLDKFGKIDILVNNAGANAKGWVKDFPEELWDKILDTNLKGTFLCSKAVLPTMITQQYGRIINIASIAGKQGESAGSAYCSSKFGMIGFTQCLALEVAQDNILVNAVCPGPIPTELGELGIRQDAELRGLDPDEFRQWFIERTPFKRQGTPEQVARMCVFVASDDCDFTTGSAFNVNGGIIMH
jgi:NAD(P)-dependent dehydrogenase (short-subunit alcohol dehydrogenase family)